MTVDTEFPDASGSPEFDASESISLHATLEVRPRIAVSRIVVFRAKLCSLDALRDLVSDKILRALNQWMGIPIELHFG